MRKNKQGDFYFHIPFAAPLTLGGSTFEHEMMRQSFAVIVHRIVCHVTCIRSVQSDPGCRGFENILFASRNWISDETEK